MNTMAHHGQRHEQDVWDKTWKDRHGNIVIYQHPNFLLIGWLLITIVSLFTNGTLSNVLWYIALAVLALWAAYEVWQGVNYFRKALGVVVLLLVIAAVFKVGY